MRFLSTKFCANHVYDGSQLAPHWILKNQDLKGDALVAFMGEAKVTIDHMVDIVDVKANAPIYSPMMLHFLGEFFIDSLMEGVLLQHLLLCEIYELLLEKGISPLRRRGNDLYYQERKASVSIATKSPVSVLIHAGINIKTEGTPIPTSGLVEMGLIPADFAKTVLEKFQKEYAIWQEARVKVSPR